MKTKMLLVSGFLIISLISYAQQYEWAIRAGGALEDYGVSVAIDASNNSYISGYFKGTADFDPGPGAANLSPSGNQDIYLAKYDADGNYLWAFNIGGTSYDASFSVTTDLSGNVYIGGFFQNTADFDPGPGVANLTSSGMEDIFLAKYDANGNYLWAFSINGTGQNVVKSVTTDASGNVYISGYFNSTADFDPGAGTMNMTSAGNKDIFLAKYDANGNYIWAFKVGGTAEDMTASITTDASGNLYMSGFFALTADFDPGAVTANLTSAGSKDIFLAKYDANGNYLWALNAGGTGNDQSSSVTADASGDVYITGYFRSTADFDPGAGTANLTSNGINDLFLAKYDASGNYLWAVGTGSGNYDEGYAVTTDVSDNVYISGYFRDTVDFDFGPGLHQLHSAGNSDIFLAKYTPYGDHLWAISLGGSAGDVGVSVITDASENIYMTGNFGSTVDFDPGTNNANLTSAGIHEIFVAKYSPIVAIDLNAAAASQNQIDLNWTENVTDEIGFVIERADSINGTFTLVGTEPANSTRLLRPYRTRSQYQLLLPRSCYR